MSFIPMYALGLMGATRRLNNYDSSTGWQPLFVLMLIGGIIIAVGVALQFAQILASFIQKNHLRDTTGDPWNGRSLEWATVSPPPFYNFAVIPHVKTRDAFWKMKQRKDLAKPVYEDIRMPKNTPAGIYISAFAFLVGFAFVWEIIWLALVSIVGIIVVFVIRAFNEDSEYTLTAAEVRQYEEARIMKAQTVRTKKHDETEQDLSIWELISVVFNFAKDVLQNKRWRKW